MAIEQQGFDETEQLIDAAAASDMVLLNKVDLVEPIELQGLRALLAETAPYTEVIETVHCAIDDLALLCGAAAGTQRGRPRTLNGRTSAQATDPEHRYRSASFEWTEPLERHQFEAIAASLVGRYWRAKGLLRFAQSPATTHVFHLVGRRATLEPVDPPQGSDLRNSTDRGSRLVVIGLASQFDLTDLEQRMNAQRVVSATRH